MASKETPPTVSSEADTVSPGVLTEEDVERTAIDYADYIIVNSQQEKQQLDERIQSIVYRVEEFQRQLDWMHQNVTSTSEKVSELHTYSQNLTSLFNKIDQIEAFVGIVTSNVDQLETAVSRAEKDLEPSKIRKVFSVLPGVKKPQYKEVTQSWTPPQLFSAKDYFSSNVHSLEPSEPISE